jgi:predicted nucleic acid-binding Zn ribbon protein
MCKLKIQDFSRIIDSMPQAWRSDANEMQALTTTLTSRQHNEILKVIIDNKTQFNNWSE